MYTSKKNQQTVVRAFFSSSQVGQSSIVSTTTRRDAVKDGGDCLPPIGKIVKMPTRRGKHMTS
jgi:hypothetical protein